MNTEFSHYGVKGMKWGVRKKYIPHPRKKTTVSQAPKWGIGENRRVLKTKSGDTIMLQDHPDGMFAKFLSKVSKNVARERERSAVFDIKDPTGKKVGDVQLYKESKNSMNITWVGTNTESRGKGYASAVMKSAIRIARDQGCSKVTLEVPGNSPDARHIYEKLGFREVASPDRDVNDIWGGLTNMELNLKDVKHSESLSNNFAEEIAYSFMRYLDEELASMEASAGSIEHGIKESENAMKYDFSGYATKHGVRCSDGRIINKGAFDSCNGSRVPLVFQHNHTDPDYVLGFVDLETRDDGVYARGSFNETKNGLNAKQMVQHGDIAYMSIYANQVKQQGSNVIHGQIREVSLVLAGANPGARIDNVTISHGEFDEEMEDEIVIHSGLPIIHEEEAPAKESGGSNEDLKAVFETLNEEQKNMVYALVGLALEDGGVPMEQSEEEGEDSMSWNIFEKESEVEESKTLSHNAIDVIFADAQRCGSLKDSVLAHAAEYGIENIDMLFPDAKEINGVHPEWIKRKTEWVSKVLNGCHHSPFSRIKMTYADITADEARAKGYVKGNFKKEEFFNLTRRQIGPCTIYKKQKLDRDDIIDITSFDVVAWIKGEMRMMLDEEIARAILIGDGREVDDEDKINETCLIPIAKEHELYATRIVLPASAKPEDEVEALIRALEDFEGTGTPDLYTSRKSLIDWRLMKDNNGRYIYDSDQQIADKIGIGSIIPVEVMRNQKLDNGNELVGIIVNLADYTIGTDKGGQIEFFDDFDIDYNQYKYLYETRVSGALTKLKSAIIVEKGSGTPEAGVGPGLEPPTNWTTENSPSTPSTPPAPSVPPVGDGGGGSRSRRM